MAPSNRWASVGGCGSHGSSRIRPRRSGGRSPSPSTSPPGSRTGSSASGPSARPCDSSRRTSRRSTGRCSPTTPRRCSSSAGARTRSASRSSRTVGVHPGSHGHDRGARQGGPRRRGLAHLPGHARARPRRRRSAGGLARALARGPPRLRRELRPGGIDDRATRPHDIRRRAPAVVITCGATRIANAPPPGVPRRRRPCGRQGSAMPARSRHRGPRRRTAGSRRSPPSSRRTGRRW